MSLAERASGIRHRARPSLGGQGFDVAVDSEDGRLIRFLRSDLRD